MKNSKIKCRDAVLSALVGLFVFFLTTGTVYSQCTSITTYPYSEGFETGFPPTCWTQTTVSGTNNWIARNGPGSTTGSIASAFAGSNNASLYGSSGVAQLVTPSFDLTSLAAPLLTFYHAQEEWLGDQDSMAVFYRTSSTGAWVRLTSYRNNINSWTLESIALPNPSSDYSLMFEGYLDFGRGIVIDQFEVKETPTCPRPVNVQAINYFPDSITIQWDGNSSSTNYEYIIVGCSAPMSSGTSVSTSLDSLRIGGLTVDSCFNLFVREICGAADTSLWTLPYSIVTSYCIPSSNGNGTYVDDFSTLGGTSNISNLSSGYTAGGYSNARNQAVVSYATGVFNFSSAIVGGTAGFSIWVDWNKDMVFDDPSEKVFNTTAYSNGPFSGSISVPIGTPVGDYTMRVAVNWLSANPSDPCETGVSRGEFEDYTITVGAPPSCLWAVNLNTVGAYADSAQLSWIEQNAATQWQIEYGASNFTLGTGIDTIVSSNPATLTGLIPNTLYDWYVRSICTAGDTSIWSVGGSFRTPCKAISQFPYYEGFDGNLPCWRQEIVSGAEEWARTKGNFGLLNNPQGGDFNMIFYGTAGVTRWISPNIDFGSLNSALMSFYYSQESSTGQDTLAVYYRTSPSAPWTYLRSYNSNVTSWTLDTITLPNLSSNYSVMFEGHLDGGISITLDELSIRPLFANNAGVVDWLSPDFFCAGTVNPVVGVKNYGTSNIDSVDVVFDINGMVDTLSYKFTILPGDTAAVALPPLPATANTLYDIKVYSLNPNGQADQYFNDDTLFLENVRTGLSGAYTLDASLPYSGTNFPSFAALQSAVSNYGLCGRATVNVANGTYNEYFYLYEIPGANSSNGLVIDGGDSSLTKIVHDGNEKFATITFNGTKHVKIQNLGIEMTGIAGTGTGARDAVLISGEAKYDTISNCYTKVPTSSSVTTNNANIALSGLDFWNQFGSTAEKIVIQNNRMIGGYYGVYAYADDILFTSHNQFYNNEIDSVTNYGAYFYYQDSLNIEGNKINAMNNGNGNGIYLYYTNNTHLKANYVWAQSYGVYFYNYTNSVVLPLGTRWNEIVNNMVYSSNSNGIRLYYEVDSVRMWHNSVNVEGSQDAVYIYGFSGSGVPTEYDVRNNIFVANTNRAFYLNQPDTIFSKFDNNIFYNQSGNLIFVDGTGYTNLAAYQTASPLWNMASLQGDPQFVSATDLHIAGTLPDTAGFNLPQVTVDIDGDVRPSIGATKVDIGADEFQPPTCSAPTNLTAFDISGDSLTIAWDLDTTTLGGIQGYEYVVVPCGTPRDSGMLVSTAFDSDRVGGILLDSCYTVFLRKICDRADFSIWIQYNINTGYCIPSFTGSSAGTTYIDNFSTTNGNQNISNLSSGHSNGGYNNARIDTVAQFASASFDFSASIVGGTAGFAIWIDWNNDLIFNDPSEKVYVSTAYSSGPFTGTITIPPRTPVGSYNMRLVVDWLSSAPSDPCEANRGEFEDYTIKVITPPPCLPPINLGASAITTDSLSINWESQEAASNFEYVFVPCGTPKSSGTVVQTTMDSVRIGGIVRDSCYQLYVREICGVGDTSNWAGPQDINTGYCSVSTTSTIDYLSAVSSTFGFANVSYTTTAQPAGSYANETAQIISSAPLDSFEINTTYVGGSNGVNVWVDWNDDLIFDEALELVASEASASASKTLTVVVPVGVPFGNYRLRVRGQWGSTSNPPPCGSVNYGSTVDFTLQIGAPPTCLSPINLDMPSVGSVSAILAWTEQNLATSWEIEYDTTGFIKGNGIDTVVSANPFNLRGLSANTEYEWYVRSICAPGDTSNWVGPLPFKTNCLPSTAPWLEDVESHSTTANSTIDNCWSSNPSQTTSSFRWNVGSGTTPSTNTGPSGAYSGSNYFFTEASNGSAGDTATLTGPLVDILALSNPEVSFYYHMYGSDINALYIELNNGSSWQLIDSIVGQQQMSISDPWLNKLIPINVSVDTIQLRFKAVRGASFDGDISIDDIEVRDIPTCPAPIDMLDSTITTTTAELHWSEAGTASTWEVEYGSANYTAGTGTSFIVTVDSILLTNINPASTYDWYVRSICGPGDTSAWSRGIRILTPCAVVTPDYSTSFNPYLPNCWEEANSGAPSTGPSGIGSSSWTSDSYLNNNSNPDAARINLYSTFRSDWLLSPEFDLSAATYELVVEAGITDYFGTSSENMGSDDTVQLLISIDSGATWQPIHTWDTAYQPTNTGLIDTVDLSAFNAPNAIFGIWASDGRTNDPEDYKFFINSFEVRTISAATPTVSYYPIGTLNTSDANGVADSINVEAWTSGTVVGVDLNAGSGLDFTLIDMASGSQEGISIHSSSAVNGYTVTEGDSIKVLGTVAQSNGLTQFIADSIEVISTGNAIPTPKVVSTLDESTESQYLEVQKFVLLDSTQTGTYSMRAYNGTDTITINIDAQTDVSDSLSDVNNSLLAGDTICLMLGIGGQYDTSSSAPYLSGYHITPMYFTDLTICKDVTIGIDKQESSNGGLTFYPNPTKGSFTIATSGLENDNAMITIRDMSGKVIVRENIINSSSAFKKHYTLEGQAKGLYLISIIDGEKRINKKLILQ